VAAAKLSNAFAGLRGPMLANTTTAAQNERITSLPKRCLAEPPILDVVVDGGCTIIRPHSLRMNSANGGSVTVAALLLPYKQVEGQRHWHSPAGSRLPDASTSAVRPR
jgi:hypothetical protein